MARDYSGIEIFTGDVGFIELTREELLNSKFSRSILPIIYAQLMPMIKDKWGTEQGKEVLRDFGRRVIRGIMRYWKPKSKNVPGIIKEVYKFLFGIKSVKAQTIKRGKKIQKWIMTDKECPLCWTGIEEEEIHYCVALSGAIEELFNTLPRTGKYKKLPFVTATTIESKAFGANRCVHEIAPVGDD